jgi:hypothetical protein
MGAVLRRCGALFTNQADEGPWTSAASIQDRPLSDNRGRGCPEGYGLRMTLAGFRPRVNSPRTGSAKAPAHP